MNSPESDRSLDVILKDWRVSPPRDAEFRPGVWARIAEKRRTLSWAGYARSHAALVAVALLVAVTAGGWVGRAQARARADADRVRIANSYVQSLDARTMRMP